MERHDLLAMMSELHTRRVKAGSVEMDFYRSHTSQTALRGAALALLKPFLLDPGSASARMLP